MFAQAVRKLCGPMVLLLTAVTAMLATAAASYGAEPGGGYGPDSQSGGSPSFPKVLTAKEIGSAGATLNALTGGVNFTVTVPPKTLMVNSQLVVAAASADEAQRLTPKAMAQCTVSTAVQVSRRPVDGSPAQPLAGTDGIAIKVWGAGLSASESYVRLSTAGSHQISSPVNGVVRVTLTQPTGALIVLGCGSERAHSGAVAPPIGAATPSIEVQGESRTAARPGAENSASAVATESDEGDLPYTGTNAGWLVPLALLLLAAGVVVVAISRRRKIE